MSYDPEPEPGTPRPRDTRAGNTHCICGSRRKYRKCCGAPILPVIDEIPPLDPPLRLPDPPREYLNHVLETFMGAFQDVGPRPDHDLIYLVSADTKPDHHWAHLLNEPATHLIPMVPPIRETEIVLDDIEFLKHYAPSR